MRQTRAMLLVGGPIDATTQNRLAKEATAFIKNRERAARLAEQLAVAISFHHMLAGMNREPVGPCREGLSILDEIEIVSD
ncbi:hypothetical protein ACSBOB_01415 [Mesorhizobium sp. ASY16-5R]|uniref:hypothetical protein n=1 Tax=Mesorhizobium sp. ASY16-5R TaxID=3445772 RepID=UPI003FA034F9